MIPLKALLAATFLGCALVPAQAQSLAEVAKKEEARRKTISEPGRVYTNSDLKPEPSPPRGNSEPDVLPDATEEPRRGEKGEAYWKGLIGGARAALERSQVLITALESRLNALTADVAARDDPAQRAQLETERLRVLQELDRMTQDVADQTKAIAAIEEDARKAGVPPGWLR
jgi:hypothetical protein